MLCWVTVARIGGASQDTTWINSHELAVRITDELLVREGTVQVTVYTPPPGGGESQPPAMLTIIPRLGDHAQ